MNSENKRVCGETDVTPFSSVEGLSTHTPLHLKQQQNLRVFLLPAENIGWCCRQSIFLFWAWMPRWCQQIQHTNWGCATLPSCQCGKPWPYLSWSSSFQWSKESLYLSRPAEAMRRRVFYFEREAKRSCCFSKSTHTVFSLHHECLSTKVFICIFQLLFVVEICKICIYCLQIVPRVSTMSE